MAHLIGRGKSLLVWILGFFFTFIFPNPGIRAEGLDSNGGDVARDVSVKQNSVSTRPLVPLKGSTSAQYPQVKGNNTFPGHVPVNKVKTDKVKQTPKSGLTKNPNAKPYRLNGGMPNVQPIPLKTISQPNDFSYDRDPRPNGGPRMPRLPAQGQVQQDRNSVQLIDFYLANRGKRYTQQHSVNALKNKGRRAVEAVEYRYREIREKLAKDTTAYQKIKAQTGKGRNSRALAKAHKKLKESHLDYKSIEKLRNELGITLPVRFQREP